MRILCLSSWYPNENDPQEGIFIKHQLEEVSKLHEVFLVSLRPGSEFNHKISIESGIKHYRYSYSSKQYLSKYLSWAIAWNKIIRDFPEENFDLIHLHVIFPLGIAALKFQKKYKSPLIVSEHWTGYDDPNNPIGNFRKKMVQHVLKKADLVLTVSEYLKNNLIEISPKSHIEVLPNIVEFSETSTNNSPERNTIRILNVSDHVDSHKNISSLLNGVQPVLLQNSSLELVLIGEGEDTDFLKTLCRELKIEDRVVFKGRLTHEEVLQEIQQSDFGVINSNFETFSIVAFEFLAAKKPIVITDCGGPIEFLPKEFGLKIPVNDMLALTEAVLKMADTFTQYKLEDSALQVRNQFSRDAFRERISEVYQKVINAQ
jgi:glycosyltransferase involved in cell wall biosynthesis